jgi:hypothetical protein
MIYITKRIPTLEAESYERFAAMLLKPLKENEENGT